MSETGVRAGMPGAPVAAAWQAALAAEHQAAFGYGLLGPHLTGAEQNLAVACSNAHDTVRVGVGTAMTSAGLEPVQPLADYPSLYPVTNAHTARVLATRLEDSCAAAWRYLYATTVAVPTGPGSSTLRGGAQRNLTASAVRAVRWRMTDNPSRASTPLPGID